MDPAMSATVSGARETAQSSVTSANQVSHCLRTRASAPPAPTALNSTQKRRSARTRCARSTGAMIVPRAAFSGATSARVTLSTRAGRRGAYSTQRAGCRAALSARLIYKSVSSVPLNSGTTKTTISASMARAKFKTVQTVRFQAPRSVTNARQASSRKMRQLARSVRRMAAWSAATRRLAHGARPADCSRTAFARAAVRICV
mmetsp:Transcript_18789/g.25478  ORF Transcript_18789/g.25478 Transcript_18789/m.25478 type:complete len:202 (+) Transcript_18789:2622-3227(+)